MHTQARIHVRSVQLRRPWYTRTGWPSDLIAANFICRARALGNMQIPAPCGGSQLQRTFSWRAPVALQIPVRFYPPGVITSRGIPRRSNHGSRSWSPISLSWESIFSFFPLFFVSSFSSLPLIRISATSPATNSSRFCHLVLWSWDAFSELAWYQFKCSWNAPKSLSLWDW